MVVSATITREAVEEFLYREAEYADQNQYDEWLALWTDDAIYWLPANSDDYDPRTHVSITYDDRDRLQDRIDRLKSGGAWSQEPKSRMRRLISNIRIEPPSPGQDVTVSSNFVLGELRRGRQTAYFAHQIHKLRPSGDGLKMSFKKVILVNNNEPIHNLSFLV